MVSRGQSNIVGIDLGTTFSVIARLESSGIAATIPNQDGESLTPSVVYMEGSTALVGREAKEAASNDSSKAAMFVKRDMGKPFYSRVVGGRQFRPETLSAIILRKLKLDAEKHIGPIKKAVITVPAFFDDTRRKATEDAGRIAGLEVLDIINEPTAAALAYALTGRQAQDGPVRTLEIPGGEMTALVYDLGGGTFDCTVVRLASKRFESLATDGAVQLGGKDWDEKIVEFMAQEFLKRHGVNPAEDTQRRDSMAATAERAKKILSKLPKASLECFHQGHELKLELTRRQFEDMTRELMAQTQIVTDLVVQQAKLTWDRIHRVLLVGGSTRMPMVKQMLRQVTGKEPDDSLDADQVVARGASIHAGIVASKADDAELEVDEELKKELEDIVEVNVNAYSLGIEAVRKDGRHINAILIPKNTQLPFAASKIFRVRKAGATTVRVKVLEGEAPDAVANILIGECLVTQLPPNLPAKSPIQVRCSYGSNGRISVMALDMAGGRFAHAEIKREYGLSESDIRKEADFVNSLSIQ